MITIEGLIHRYEDEIALDAIDLSIESGAYVLVLGRNGSGKTTLLRHLNGLLLPDEGRVTIDGLSTDANTAHARETVGMVFQDAQSQIVSETVRDDIAFGPGNLGLERDEIRERVRDAAAAVGATPLLDRSPYELSGGELRRVALAGVLAMRPDALALDEPLAGLDLDGERAVLERISEANDRGGTVVVATHDAEPFARVATRVLVMEGGQIVEDGSPEMLLADGLDRYGIRTPGTYR